MKLLHLVSVPHNTVIDFHVWSDLFENDSLVRSKLIKPLYYENEEMLQHKLFSVTFVKQYGDRVSPIKVMVNPSFKGEYHYQGNKALVLEGDFGMEFTSLLTWTQNLVNDANIVNEIWPEYTIEGDIDLEYTLRIFPFGSTDIPEMTFHYHQKIY